MLVETYLPIKVEINYKQAIDVLKSTAMDITERDSCGLRKRDWHGLTYSDIDHKVYYEHCILEFLTEEEHEFIGSIIKLVEAQEKYEHPLVF